MKKRTLWTALAVTFVVVAVVAPFTGQNQSAGDIVIGIIGCLAIAALFWWLRGRTDPEAQFRSKSKQRQAKRIKVPDNYTAIDIETTGLDTSTARIIELGAVRIRHGKPVAKFSQLVNPGFPIPADSIRVTGITDKDVRRAPDSTKALRRFLAFIGHDTLIGHNIDAFDMPIIRNEAKRDGLKPPTNQTIDTLSIARHIWPGERNRLVDVIRRLGIAKTESHRAESDAMQTAQTFEAMKRL
ncbi:exonuclease, DNA polymerase III, epsilon subunit family [Bifidobacterium animalis subsp. lactis]|nr:exonuclease, DNA polymerase III, epsilon subunit family [Bifidobacterium animalis subsp. lactis]